MPPQLERAEIQEAERKRFLDLVRVRSNQEDNRDVSLANLHGVSRFRVGDRLRQLTAIRRGSSMTWCSVAVRPRLLARAQTRAGVYQSV